MILGTSDAIQSLHCEIDRAARSDAKVLITGATGVGKELVARAIHERSARHEHPFVTINCAGVPDTLLESEFFGHVRGSFTDAYRDNPGLLRQAHRGTVFLDEVGEMSLRLQALLLRFLETGEVQTVGAAASPGARVDVRVITATNRDLGEAVAARDFREDLYYRLNVLHLQIPPLKDRGSDVDLLVQHYLEAAAEQHRLPCPMVSRSALDRLRAYPWPGNVRELRNVVERLVLRADAPVIEPAHLPGEIVVVDRPVEQEERARISVSHQARVEGLLNRVLVEKESFWTSVYATFMSRDITRDDLRYIVQTGLERTRGSYRLLLELFNMAPDDYKRFLGFLKQHDCHLPFQRFRVLNARVAPDTSRAPARTVA
jgi:DNA-binding NtrC family response regulator